MGTALESISSNVRLRYGVWIESGTFVFKIEEDQFCKVLSEAMERTGNVELALAMIRSEVVRAMRRQ